MKTPWKLRWQGRRLRDELLAMGSLPGSRPERSRDGGHDHDYGHGDTRHFRRSCGVEHDPSGDGAPNEAAQVGADRNPRDDEGEYQVDHEQGADAGLHDADAPMMETGRRRTEEPEHRS